MNKQKDLDQLFSELQSFLKVLDTESLSCVAESKKESVAELLQELNGSPCTEQSGFIPAEDADYMFMSCVTLTENRLEMQLPANANEPRNVLEIIEDTEDISPCPPLSDDFQTKVAQAGSSPSPHQANEVHPDDSYEEAEPLSPLAQCTVDCVDSDSSHYESYGEEEVSSNNQTASLRRLPTDSLTRPLPHSRICGFLWRKKWLGQWTKQLFLIRDQVLMCYKCMKDQYPLMELSLQGSRVAYKFKRSKKIQHELKITTASNETLVLGLQSREQTEDWRKVVEEVSSNMHSRASPWNSPTMPGAETKCASSKSMLRGSRGSDLERSTGEMVTDSPATRDTGYLKVLVNSHWQTLWCHVEDRVLLMYKDVGRAGRLHYSVDLQGCEVRTQADAAHKYRLIVSHQHKDLAVLQTSSPEDRDRWLSLLQARCGTDTESAHLYEETVLQTGTETDPRDGNQVSGLLQRRITTPNTYMDDPFGHVSSIQTTPEDGGTRATRQTQRVDLPSHEVVNGECTALPERDQHSNTNNNNTARYNTLPSAFPQSSFLKSWSDFEIKTCGAEKEPVRNQATQTDKKDFKEAMDSVSERRTLPRLEEKIRRLEQAVYRAKERVKSGSELNLLSLSKTFKRASCGQSLALFSSNSETTNPEVPIVSPILRRTASAKSCLRRTPSVTVVEKGRVLQKTKEWEMKSSV
ncbi:actin filament-associated protein 1-like 1 isoform X1 [Carcharodon carcharias]|uniref:actin filament-associated protein 1-like 1 isoform X1 n=1 Tax=Carcharodon carcharias TaxID=13397 RepID=UPI001B7EABA5|nr:actin filament-associated protein 1-like 1 isoform X1 [Carcharodon carcharias]